MTVDISKLSEREQKIFHMGRAVGTVEFVNATKEAIDECLVIATISAFKENFPQKLEELDEPKITVVDGKH